MPRKSQANLKTVELIDQIRIEGLKGDLELLERKSKMWMRAWVSEHLDPRPEARVSYTVSLSKEDDPIFSVGCYVQIYSEEGFFQAYQVGKDPRRAMKAALKVVAQRLNEVRMPHRLVLLPRGFAVQQAS